MLQHLLKTQKAVAKSRVCSMMICEPKGNREVFTYNTYSSIELTVFVYKKCKILIAGTMCKNRKGTDKNLMDMKKNYSEMGDSKIYHDKVNKVAIT